MNIKVRLYLTYQKHVEEDFGDHKQQQQAEAHLTNKQVHTSAMHHMVQAIDEQVLYRRDVKVALWAPHMGTSLY